MTTPIFTGSIDKGKLILDQPERYLVHLAGLNNRRIELILRKRRSKRSDNQNRWYWGVCVEILANHCGYEADQMHEALKWKFLSGMVPDNNGLTTVRSTAKMSTDEFIKYTNQVVRWAAEELGVFIPDPRQCDY
jgi:hypothetical protein